MLSLLTSSSPMTFFFLLAGVALVLLTMVDALWTTVTAAGGGPLTRRLSHFLWRIVRRVHRRFGIHALLTFSGATILLSALGVWITLLWAGYVLIFSAEPGAIVHSQGEAAATFWERVYFTGFTLFTLGIGDLVPQGALWRVVTAVGSLNGIFLLTLSITYLVSVLSAVVAKRQLAGTIANMGMSPQGIVLQSLGAGHSSYLVQHLVQLVPMIEQHTRRHLAFPALHFFHSDEVRSAIAPRMAALDEALLLVESGLDEGNAPPAEALAPARHAVAAFLDTLEEALIVGPSTPPPAPDTSRLQEQGFSTTPERLAAAARRTARRRRLLKAFVEDDGWEWRDVTEPPEGTTRHFQR